METYLKALDEYFCAQYSDYTRISAIEGYKMPDMLYIGKDGNLSRKDSSKMRIAYQKNKDEILQALKKNLVDTDFTFSFRFRTLREKFSDRFQKYTFSKVLPVALKHCNATAEEAGEKLNIEPLFWQKIVKGKLYPEKNVVLALALVCRMQSQDVQNLLNVCGYSMDAESVRDVVVQYLIEQKIFNEEMRDNCLAEYKITNLPMKKRAQTESL